MGAKARYQSWGSKEASDLSGTSHLQRQLLTTSVNSENHTRPWIANAPAFMLAIRYDRIVGFKVVEWEESGIIMLEYPSHLHDGFIVC